MIVGEQSNFYLRNENFQKNKEEKLKSAVPSDLKGCSFTPNGRVKATDSQIGEKLYQDAQRH